MIFLTLSLEIVLLLNFLLLILFCMRSLLLFGKVKFDCRPMVAAKIFTPKLRLKSIKGVTSPKVCFSLKRFSAMFSCYMLGLNDRMWSVTITLFFSYLTNSIKMVLYFFFNLLLSFYLLS